MIRFPPAKERPLDLEVHVIFWCSREVGEAERGVKGLLKGLSFQAF